MRTVIFRGKALSFKARRDIEMESTKGEIQRRVNETRAKHSEYKACHANGGCFARDRITGDSIRGRKVRRRGDTDLEIY